MGVIILLMAMLFMGIRHVTMGMKINATKATLSELQAMFSTYEQTTHLQRCPQTWVSGAGFWTDPVTMISPSLSPPPPPGANRIDLDTFTNQPPGDWKLTEMIQTVLVMNMLTSIPENQKIISNLPNGAVKMVTVTFAAQTITGPVLLDAWNDPIIFVPSGRLENVTFAASLYTIGMQKGQLNAWYVTSVQKGQMPIPATLSGQRPFFASQGPDGDMATGDDNIYSFEN
jgi:hypothetical protein